MAGAAFDPVLDLLPRAPLHGLDIAAVQRERKGYWDRFMERYSTLSAECTEEVALRDIGKPAAIAQLKRLKTGKVEMPTTRAFKRYMRDQGELVDELTTLAGPPLPDEEELSSEEEDGEDDEVEGEEEGDEEEREIDAEDKEERGGDERDLAEDSETETSEVDFSSPLAAPARAVVYSSNSSSSGDEEALYSPPGRRRDPGTPSAGATPQRLALHRAMATSTPASTPSRTRHPAPAGEEPEHLVCDLCGAEGDIEVELGRRPEFRCDACLLDRTHADCEEPDCCVCRDVAATVEARWILRSRLEETGDEEDEEEMETAEEEEVGEAEGIEDLSPRISRMSMSDESNSQSVEDGGAPGLSAVRRLARRAGAERVPSLAYCRAAYRDSSTEGDTYEEGDNTTEGDNTEGNTGTEGDNTEGDTGTEGDTAENSSVDGASTAGGESDQSCNSMSTCF